MMSIDDVHIRQLDMSLLLVFEAVSKHRNMTLAARDLGLTQSAVSHAVGRLRAIFGDRLFDRERAGVAPTVRALNLAPHLAEALASIRGAMQIGRAFDPRTTVRRFAVAAPDTILVTLAPVILTELQVQASGCQVAFLELSHAAAADAVIRGDADLSVGVFADIPQSTVGRVVGSETFNVAARRGHPGLTAGLTLQTYLALDHVVVSTNRDATDRFDPILHELGRRRRVAASMPNLVLAFAMASQSDVIVTAPLGACTYAASLFPLSIHPIPFPSPTLNLTLLRRREAVADPAIDWLTQLVSRTMAASAAEQRTPTLGEIGRAARSPRARRPCGECC